MVDTGLPLPRGSIQYEVNFNGALTDDQLASFQRDSFVNLGKVLSDEDVARFHALFETDQGMQNFWHQYGHSQYANYDALLTQPSWDELIRHPAVLPAIEALMGSTQICCGEVGLRMMPAWEAEFHQSWHRDKAHAEDHPLRLDYLQMMVYLADVDESTHCISFSPEDVSEEVIADNDQQLATRGDYNLHGPAGTIALFNSSALHTATTRPTTATRKTVQVYYGHLDKPYLANDSVFPPILWRDAPEQSTREFYGNLNERTKTFMRAFPATVAAAAPAAPAATGGGGSAKL
jgi:hypothetical protein